MLFIKTVPSRFVNLFYICNILKFVANILIAYITDTFFMVRFEGLHCYYSWLGTLTICKNWLRMVTTSYINNSSFDIEFKF